MNKVEGKLVANGAKIGIVFYQQSFKISGRRYTFGNFIIRRK